VHRDLAGVGQDDAPELGKSRGLPVVARSHPAHQVVAVVGCEGLNQESRNGPHCRAPLLIDQIASIAMANRLCLVTHNTKEFTRIKDLPVEARS
jgi:hypothetical protein